MDRYTVESVHPFFDMVNSIVSNEIRMGNTVTLLTEVDLSEVEHVRRTYARAGRQKPSYTAFVAKAVACALKEFPYANRRIIRNWLPFTRVRMQQFNSSDISFAVERDIPNLEVATFVDVIRDLDSQPLSAITKQLHALATCDESNNTQWREFKNGIGRLPRWLAALLVRLPLYLPGQWTRYRGGSVLISSPAKYGVDSIVGAWTSPVGVSFGYVKQRPVVKDGVIVACPTFVLTVNFDRRVMAGAQAARFYRRIVDLLVHASAWLTEDNLESTKSGLSTFTATLEQSEVPEQATSALHASVKL
jgi:pyruvate/2-oxoglutarate dehydrogenase complex dihydrolipoamide acyltransferase (E2) component